MNTPAVAIRESHKRFGNLHAVRGVDLEIQPGEFFGLLGPNGAGKSTLISMMAGLVRPTAGTIEVVGHDVISDYRRARQALGVVPQELVYDPFFTVWEMLRLQSGYFGLGRSNEPWLKELLSTLDLTEKRNTNLQRLSGGMKRRVLIAQAMVHKPPVLVLDEPTAGVDVELRQALWTFTRKLHQEGHTILLTTHYLEEAEALCDRIGILHHGRLIALDSKQSLLGRHPYRLLCITLGEKSGPLPEALEPMMVEHQENQLTLRLHREHDPVGSVLEALREAGLQVMDLHTKDPGLEEVFMHLTGGKGAEADT